MRRLHRVVEEIRLDWSRLVVLVEHGLGRVVKRVDRVRSINGNVELFHDLGGREQGVRRALVMVVVEREVCRW